MPKKRHKPEEIVAKLRQSLALPKTVAHSEKLRLVVMTTLVRS